MGGNAASFAAITQVNLNEQRADNTNVSVWFPKFKVGDEFYLQHKTDATRWGRYVITALGVDHGTWWSWAVTYLGSAGTFFTGSNPIRVSLLTEGEVVEQWLGGSGAPAGGLGNVGDWYLNTSNGDVYEKTASATWTLRTNITGPAGGAGTTIPVVASVSALNSAYGGSPTDGALGVIVVDDSPIHLRYDTSLGKWVAQMQTPLTWLHNAGTNHSYNATAYDFTAASFISTAPFYRPHLPWKVYDDVGLGWQFRLSVYLANSSSTGTCLVIPTLLPINYATETYNTANAIDITGAEISHAGANVRLIKGAWGMIPGSPTVRDEFACVLRAKNTGTGSPSVVIQGVPSPFLELRLASK